MNAPLKLYLANSNVNCYQGPLLNGAPISKIRYIYLEVDYYVNVPRDFKFVKLDFIAVKPVNFTVRVFFVRFGLITSWKLGPVHIDCKLIIIINISAYITTHI